MSPSLKHLLTVLPLGLGTGLLASTVAGPAESPPRPDIVFILLDDLRWDGLSFMGHPFVQTPHLDRLREQGAMMQNAFVTTSICCPSRATFLTGTFANRHGVIDNETSEYNPDVTPPLTKQLQEAGYETAMVGKWHMGSTAAPRPYFDHWLSFKGQGVYHDPEVNINGEKVQLTGYTTDLLTDHAIAFVEEQPRDRPYFLMLSHKAVHEPFEPAERHEYAFGRDAVTPRPASWDDDFSGKPLWQRRQQFSDYRWAWRTRDIEAEQVPDVLPLEPWRRNTKYVDQYRCLAAVDDGVGRLVEAVRQRGNLANTIFVFTSDNGYFHLEHRRWDKRLAYEESLRIPMIVVYPGHIEPGASIPQMVMNVDFAPTILDYAGVEIPELMQGASMRPLFESPAPAWRESIFYEYWTDLVHSIPTTVAVRTDRHKLIRFPDLNDIDELYDLAEDPHEMNNLAVLPGHEALHERMTAMLQEQMVASGWRRDVFPHNLPRYRAQRGTILDLAVEQGRLVDHADSGLEVTPGSAIVEQETLRFAGGAPGLRVAFAPVLDPSSWPYRIELEVKAERDGVIAAHAGSHSGFKLFVQDGRPGIAVLCRTWIASTTTIDGPQSILGQWTRLQADIDYNRVTFFVDGVEVDSVPLPQPFKAPTRSPLILGAPGRHEVVPGTPNDPFVGEIRRVTVNREML